LLISEQPFFVDSQGVCFKHGAIAGVLNTPSEYCAGRTTYFQQRISYAIGKTPSTISNWCRNVKQPDLEMLFEIAIVIGMEPGALINTVKKAGL
jgi:transcriptional regulator with XRE-family HTH domain